MSEMIVRVARALAVHQFGNPESWEDQIQMARAAMEAMRLPTDAMTEFGDDVRGNHADYEGGNGTDNIWRAMVDKAFE
jgi:hypothetical protein